MEFKLAQLEDVSQIVRLQDACHKNNLGDQPAAQGFLNTVLEASQLHTLIQQQALFVVKHNEDVIAMAVCASWQFWSWSTTLSALARNLDKDLIDGKAVNAHNSVFWGPVCIEKSWRGQGIFEQLVTYCCKHMPAKTDFLYTYVHHLNQRSYQAHRQKAGFITAGDARIGEDKVKTLVRPISLQQA